mgnify:CR=1 FL=1
MSFLFAEESYNYNSNYTKLHKNSSNYTKLNPTTSKQLQVQPPSTNQNQHIYITIKKRN